MDLILERIDHTSLYRSSLRILFLDFVVVVVATWLYLDTASNENSLGSCVLKAGDLAQKVYVDGIVSQCMALQQRWVSCFNDNSHSYSLGKHGFWLWH